MLTKFKGLKFHIKAILYVPTFGRGLNGPSCKGNEYTGQLPVGHKSCFDALMLV